MPGVTNVLRGIADRTRRDRAASDGSDVARAHSVDKMGRCGRGEGTHIGVVAPIVPFAGPNRQL
jgi:hypothetical protein